MTFYIAGGCQNAEVTNGLGELPDQPPFASLACNGRCPARDEICPLPLVEEHDCLAHMNMSAEWDIVHARIIQTLYAHKLAQFQCRTSHLGQFGDETLHIAFSQHERRRCIFVRRTG